MKLGTLNLQNEGNANQVKKQGQAGYDFPQGTTFIRKLEKLIMEGIMWYTKGQSEHERLIHLLRTIFPGKRKEDQEWRQRLYGACTMLEMDFTQSGYVNDESFEYWKHCYDNANETYTGRFQNPPGAPPLLPKYRYPTNVYD